MSNDGRMPRERRPSVAIAGQNITVTGNYMPLVRINAPGFYQDAEFIDWLNNAARNQATWHTKGFMPTDFSDLFFTVDDPEGSDSDMPGHIWAQILALCREALDNPPHTECLVWLSNLEE